MNPVIGRFVSVALLLVAFAASGAQDLPDVEGTWLSGDGDGWIEITHAGNGLSGTIKGSPNASDDDSSEHQSTSNTSLDTKAETPRIKEDF